MANRILALLICFIGLHLTAVTLGEQPAEERDTGLRFVFPFYPAELDILIGHLQTKVSRRQNSPGSDHVGSNEEVDVEDVESNSMEEDQNEARSRESREETEIEAEEERLEKLIGYLEEELFRVTQSLESCEEINAGNHEAGSYIININDKGDVADPPGGRANKLETITALRAEVKAAEAKLDLCRFKFWTGGSRALARKNHQKER